jgi:bacteriorhodopsin
MAINVPAAWANTTPKAIFDIIKLEAGPSKLPVSIPLMGGCLAAFAIGQTAVHALAHNLLPSIGFGIGCAALLALAAFGVLPFYKNSRDQIIQSLTALSAVGAFIALTSIVLHFVFAVALPPPLPTERLVNFLLFPIVLWLVFGFAFIFRHNGLRMIPAFALAITYAIIVDFIMATLIH